MPSIIKITRKQFFDDIWEMTFVRVCEKYCISLNELHKVCEEKNIPIPYKNYRYDKAKGRPVYIPELPPPEDELIELHCVWKRRKKIESNLGSKANAVCILQILEDYSDANKSLSVADIIRLMEENYRLQVDRRTVYNTVKLLDALGYEIEASKEGGKCYYSLLDKTLEPFEVKIIMDSLSLNPLLSLKLSDEISNKINMYMAKRMPVQRTWYWHTGDEEAGFIEKYDIGDSLYYVLDEIDAAIMQGKKLSFDYQKYDTNGNKVLYNDEKYVVSPGAINIRNFTYYMMCKGPIIPGDNSSKNVSMEFRLDRMVNVRMTDEPAGSSLIGGRAPVVGSYDYGRDYCLCAVMKCDNELLEKITDDFANDMNRIKFNDNNDGKTFTFTLPYCDKMQKLAFWAAGAMDKCEVLEPVELREMVIEIIKNNKYGVS